MRLVLFLLVSFQGYAQSYFTEHFGGKIGLIANVGSHNNSIGLIANGFYTDHFFQINVSSSIYFNTKGYGNRNQFIEARNAIGLLLMVDRKKAFVNYHFDALSHNTNHRYALGYNYIFYNDNKGTSQNSGGFSLHLDKISILHENDVFGGQAKDRFRTGHFQISYTDSLYRIGLGVNMWTGETANTTWWHSSTPQTPYGYRILEENQYGGTSHGILYASFDAKFPFQQVPGLKIGIDSEEVRHFFQNKLFHDLSFLPKTFQRTTPHYPRIDEHGCATFDPANRRKDRLYLQLGLNDYYML